MSRCGCFGSIPGASGAQEESGSGPVVVLGESPAYSDSWPQGDGQTVGPPEQGDLHELPHLHTPGAGGSMPTEGNRKITGCEVT